MNQQESSNLTELLKRMQMTFQKEYSSGFHTIVCPKFISIGNPSSETVLKPMTCKSSTKENITAHDWQMLVTAATEIAKSLGNKALKNDSKDIVEGSLIAIRCNNQGMAVAVLTGNVSRDLLYTMSRNEYGITFSFVLPTHSAKKVQPYKGKRRTALATA